MSNPPFRAQAETGALDAMGCYCRLTTDCLDLTFSSGAGVDLLGR